MKFPLMFSWLSFVLGFCAFWLGGCASSSVPRSSSTGAFRLIAAPQSLRSNEVTLVWERPAAGSGLRYEVFRDGISIARTAKTYLTVRDLAPERDYAFSVRASSVEDARLLSDRLKVRTLPTEHVVSVLDHGAVGDGETLDTRPIQAAIDACPKGCVVRIPAGVFLSGALYLKSDMTLEIA